MQVEIKEAIFNSIIEHLHEYESQPKLAKILEIPQPAVYWLLTGDLEKLSIDRLTHIAKKLNLKVTFKVTATKEAG